MNTAIFSFDDLYLSLQLCITILKSHSHILVLLQGFGQANHQVAQQLIQKAYDYPKENITWSNGGY